MIHSACPFWRAHSLVFIGYPRPDATLRSWLHSGEISDTTLLMVWKRLHGNVHALLTVTCTALEHIDSGSKKGIITKSKCVELR